VEADPARMMASLPCHVSLSFRPQSADLRSVVRSARNHAPLSSSGNFVSKLVPRANSLSSVSLSVSVSLTAPVVVDLVMGPSS
jgi:hypothetical protein